MRPGYDKGPRKLEDHAFCRTPHLQLLSSHPPLSHIESTEYRDGEAQAMVTKHQCLEFKEKETKAMTKKGKRPEFRE